MFLSGIYFFIFHKMFNLTLTCPPIDRPVTPKGPSPFLSHQCNKTNVSNIKQPPMTKMSDTLCNAERL